MFGWLRKRFELTRHHRICSLLSLHPYFGTLVRTWYPRWNLQCWPITDSMSERNGLQSRKGLWLVTVLTRQQAKDFVKFMVIVVVLYIGKSSIIQWPPDVPSNVQHRISDDIHTTCSRHIYTWRDELGSDQSLLWVKLSRICESLHYSRETTTDQN